MAMPALVPRRWTAAAVRALPDEPGRRYECVDGELLVSPGPQFPHQILVGSLFRALEEYGLAHGVGAAFMAPGELELDDHTLVQPDLFVLPRVDGRHPRTAAEIGHPLLFIEVLSPSTARFDRVVKRERYQRAQVEYWIVDPDARLVERWLPDVEHPTIHTDHVVWQPSERIPALTIALAPLFEYALG
jgi:Uma2 family endonuclease